MGDSRRLALPQSQHRLGREGGLCSWSDPSCLELADLKPAAPHVSVPAAAPCTASAKEGRGRGRGHELQAPCACCHHHHGGQQQVAPSASLSGRKQKKRGGTSGGGDLDREALVPALAGFVQPWGVPAWGLRWACLREELREMQRGGAAALSGPVGPPPPPVAASAAGGSRGGYQARRCWAWGSAMH